jgi:hypothetical protein
MDVASPYTDSFGGKSVQGVGAQAFLGGMRWLAQESSLN